MENNELYYKRGLYMIDKLLKLFTNDSSFYIKRECFVENEFMRYSNFKDIAAKDARAFVLTGLVALLGMNKENIEKLDKNSDYNFNIFSKKVGKELEQLKMTYPLFEDGRVLNTKYDEWLNVTNLAYPTIDYMYNIRNGLLHSEYGFYGDYGDVIYVKNGNYTKFEGKILLTAFIKFTLFYFGNSSYSGLSENTYLFNIKFENQLKNENELSKALDELEIINIEYKLKGDSKTIFSPELKLLLLASKEILTEKNVYDKLDRLYRNNSDNHIITTTKLSEDKKKLTKKILETYYGEELYNMDIESQKHSIRSSINYLIDSRSAISEWIVDYIETIIFIEDLEFKRSNYDVTAKEFYNELRNVINKEMSIEVNKRTVIACRTSLLIMKAYHILYRLQNKSFEEIDFNDVYFNFTNSDYIYTRIDTNGTTTINNFNDDVLKVITKNPTLNNIEAYNKVVCEIIRDALSHGNIDLEFKIDANNQLQEYIVFSDIYHSKTRILEMTLDKFETFLNSHAFLSKYAKSKVLTKIK